MTALGGCAADPVVRPPIVDKDAGVDASVEPDAAIDPTADASLPHPDAGFMPKVDSGPEEICECTETGPCCDGCHPLALGSACDDGLECRTDTICLADGTCGAGKGACDSMMAEPQCQAISCSEADGCGAITSARESLICDDEDERTLNDRCEAGACVGDPCECDSTDECCDGCMPQNDEGSCSTPVPGTHGDAACAAGVCVGEPCECTEGPCCDGCFFRSTEWKCGDNVIYESSCSPAESTSCPGHSIVVWNEHGDRYCSGSSAECDGAVDHLYTESIGCSSNRYCVLDDDGAQCDQCPN
jgi:hypothetical protein